MGPNSSIDSAYVPGTANDHTTRLKASVRVGSGYCVKQMAKCNYRVNFCKYFDGNARVSV